MKSLIDLDAIFQRDVFWSKRDQQACEAGLRERFWKLGTHVSFEETKSIDHGCERQLVNLHFEKRWFFHSHSDICQPRDAVCRIWAPRPQRKLPSDSKLRHNKCRSHCTHEVEVFKRD